MRLPEQKLYDSLRRNKPRNVLIQRIENSLSPGMPDVLLQFSFDEIVDMHQEEFCMPGGRSKRSFSVFVELKAKTAPKRAVTPLLRKSDFTPSQIPWHLNWYKWGGLSFLLVRDERHALYLLPGRLIRTAYTRSFRAFKQDHHKPSWQAVWEAFQCCRD